MLLDAAFPPQCLKCGTIIADAGALCDQCWPRLRFIEAPYCARCGVPFGYSAGEGALCGACSARPGRIALTRSVLHYDEESRDLVLAYKHGDRLDLAPSFARWMARQGREALAGSPLLVPVPLHWWRLFRRRHNQAASLAHALAREAGLCVIPDLLERVRATASQGDMRSARARRRNVAGAFRLNARAAARVRGAPIVLIDDVLTTGATLEACARVLLHTGSKEIRALTLARVVRGQDVT
ncbi:MAG: ComF family protein [Alphaproteobacteria bacterium]|nr:ComF family protein [Alphaproteobacteria bacterium]